MLLKIANLNLRLNENGCELPFALPVCHEKFIQTATFAQSESFYISHLPGAGSVGYLDLDLSCGRIPLPEVSDSPLLEMENWGLWQRSDGNYIFKYTFGPVATQITVTPDFTCGDVLLELISFKGEAFYPLGNLESRLFSVWLANTGDFIMHASGISTNGEGFCFLGESGAGKSTLAGMLSQDPGITVLGEDQVILRYLDGQFWIFGTPWHQNPHMCSQIGVPLTKMFFLDRSAPPGKVALKPVDGVSRLLQLAIIPYHLPQQLPRILDRLSLLAENNPFFSLSYTLETNPWPMIQAA